MSTIFHIQTVFHIFKLNYDVQQIIFFHIFSYYQYIINKNWFNHLFYKNIIFNRISSYERIECLGYMFFDVFKKHIAIDFYRCSKFINNKYDIQKFYPYFVCLRDFYIFEKRPWNKIIYDKNNTFYKMCKKSLKLFYKKYCLLTFELKEMGT